MQSIASTTYLPARPARTQGAFGTRFLNWLVALDAGYRNAHHLAACTDERLADMGLSRTEAEAEFARRLGDLDNASVTTPGW